MHGCEQKVQSKMWVKYHEHKNQTSVEIQFSEQYNSRQWKVQHTNLKVHRKSKRYLLELSKVQKDWEIILEKKELERWTILN